MLYKYTMHSVHSVCISVVYLVIKSMTLIVEGGMEMCGYRLKHFEFFKNECNI